MTCKETGKYGPYMWENINRNSSLEAQMLDLLNLLTKYTEPLEISTAWKQTKRGKQLTSISVQGRAGTVICNPNYFTE